MKISNILLYLIIFLLLPFYALAATDSAEADFTPWSGYWWPDRYGALGTGIYYNGHPAPLEKYELLKDGTYPGPATQWYLNQRYDPDAPAWYGLCEAWSAASVFEKIEFFPSVIDNIYFYVGDKKGLLTACHQHDISVKANSHAPEIFHLWLLRYIKEQGKAFYGDLDGGPEIWNYPIYKYEMETNSYGYRMDVTCKIWYADDLVDPDYVGTKAHTKTYTYTLYLSEGEITGGEWTGSNVVDHPEMLAIPLSQATANPYLDYEFIREIAVSKDDELESDEPSELKPGRYNLILLDRDDYFIPTVQGDTISLKFEKLDKLSEPIEILITDNDENVIYSEGLTETKEIKWVAESSKYNIVVSREDYKEAGFYSILCDIKREFEFADTNMPKVYGWGGFAITNPTDKTIDGIYIVGITPDGSPIETYHGPFSLSPFKKKIILISDFDVRKIDESDFKGVKIIGNKKLDILDLSGKFDGNLSCFTNGDNQRFVIPDMSVWWNTQKNISWGIYNNNMDDAYVEMTQYSRDGSVSEKSSFAVSDNGVKHFDVSNSPFHIIEDNGWVLVKSVTGKPLKGYIQWNEHGSSRTEKLSPLVPGKNFFIPHVADTDYWDLNMTLINLENRENRVMMRIVNKGEEYEAEIDLNPNEKKLLEPSLFFTEAGYDFFNGSAMEIVADGEMAGYYSYISSNDYAHFPLLTSKDIRKEFSIPHIASDHYWWTAVNFFNPYDENVLISILPYDSQGNLMEDIAIDTREIRARSKDVFIMTGLFGDRSKDVSCLKMKVTSGPGLMGIYCYGSMDTSMVSGRTF